MKHIATPENLRPDANWATHADFIGFLYYKTACIQDTIVIILLLLLHSALATFYLMN